MKQTPFMGRRPVVKPFVYPVALVVALALVAGTLALRDAPDTDLELARRLLWLHGDLGTPKSTTRMDGVLSVVTADGHTTFVADPLCDERLGCSLGFTLLCWSREHIS